MTTQQGKITVIVMQPSGPPKRYRRPLAGLTVNEAFCTLKQDESFPPFGVPVYVNREERGYSSQRILQEEDILRMDDP